MAEKMTGHDEKSRANEKVSIIIPMYNASRYIDRCLGSCVNQTYKNYEIVVVDDGSTDDSPTKAKKFGIKLVHLSKGGSASKARNFGVRNSSGKIIVFIDADIILKNDSVEKIVNDLQTSRYDVINGRYTQDPPINGFYSHFQNLLLVFRLNHLSEQITFTNTAYCAMYKETFLKVKGFDEKMKYYEDIEFGHRLTRNGYRSKMNNKLMVSHLKEFTHLGLLLDYFKKGKVSGSYKRNNFLQGMASDEVQWYFKLSGISSGLIIMSLLLLWFSYYPLIFSVLLYTLCVVIPIAFLMKTRGFIFGIFAYFTGIEMFFTSLCAHAIGFIFDGKNK